MEGKNIPPPDGRTTADTYVTLTINGEKKKVLTEKTKPQKKGLEAPKWAQQFELYVPVSPGRLLARRVLLSDLPLPSSIDHNATELQIQVQDWNRIVAAEVLASATVPISKELVGGATVDKWFALKSGGKAKSTGELHLKLSLSKKKSKSTSDTGSKANLSPLPDKRPSTKNADPASGRGGKSEKVRSLNHTLAPLTDGACSPTPRSSSTFARTILTSSASSSGTPRT